MEFKGIIVKFALYTPDMLEKMRADLGLQMPVSCLQTCAAYYQSALRRDPTLDEIRILDAIWAKQSTAPEALAVAELLTNDNEVAATYADLMQKRHALAPTAKSAPTVNELLSLAGEYLRRAGRAGAPTNQSFLLEDRKLSPSASASSTYALTADARFGLRATGKAAPTLACGDVWAALSSPDSNAHLRTALDRLWRTPDLTREIKEVRLMGESGLLGELIQSRESVSVDLSKLHNQDPTVGGLCGLYLVRVSGARFGAFAEAIRIAGIVAHPLATVGKAQKNNAVTLVANGAPAIVWTYEFLDALLAPVSYRVTLADEAEGETCAIDTCPLTAEGSAYLAYREVGSDLITRLFDGASVAVATAKPESRFFHNAFDTALAPVMMLASAGVAFTDVSIAVSLTLPTLARANVRQIGAAVSTILGVYRLQTELGLSTATCKITASDEVTLPELTVFAITASATAQVGGFAAPDHALSCFAPKMRETGLPEMNDLRRLLFALADMRRRGVALSARPLLGKTVGEMLKAMETDTVSALDAYAIEGIERPERYAVLWELGEAVEAIEAVEISRTEAKERDAESASEALPVSECLIPTLGKTVVTLVAHETDADAQILAEALEDRGAVVKLFDGCEESGALLAHTILLSQALIVCRDVTLNADAHLKFAIDTLARANGYILFPAREKAPKMRGATAIAGGLTAEMLDQIVNN